ncbi:transmembrane anterior posterior transformation protein 1 homolog [Corticium candelabrum]|uniref:transmembrane anterior posterior transformation protein 1 homolog n=1 Tax=Corticium candelabrum TaxID=121492 RepID=UPI002E2685B9|nr:transmembrane anterior posterior transformation protein 1 homolog [Corticium candelabrum]
MRTPKNLENLMVFGFLLCLHTFLYVFTFLPLRVIAAAVSLVFNIFTRPWKPLLNPAQICDLLRGVIFCVCFCLLFYIDNSMLYHLVRGQAVIKLYVIHNVLEIADKLMSSFGQDALDALFAKATSRSTPRWKLIFVIPHILIAIVYVFVHAGLVLTQATVLNVAINSHNKALLTIMISNQFVEMKSNAFKRFETNNLFQISCQDIRERFHYAVLLSIVLLRNMAELDWNEDHLWTLIPILFGVMASEFVVDWIKHAFILKFNNINSNVYKDFRRSLAKDVVIHRRNMAPGDQLDVVSRRIGFIPLPLGCLVTRVAVNSIHISGITGIALILIIYLCLVCFKILISIILLGKACRHWISDEDESSRETYPSRSSTHKLPNFVSTKLPASPFIRPQLTPSVKGTSVTSTPLVSTGHPVVPDMRDGRPRLHLDEVNRFTLCGGSIL